MRQVVKLVTSVGALLCCGCCPELTLFWTVEGEFVQGGTGLPLSGEIISIRLLSDGEMIGGGVVDPDTPIPLTADGGFEVPTPLVRGSGSCGFGFQPPLESLGQPPDEIEIVLQIADGREATVVVPILEENIGEITEYRGVELSGVINLRQILVPDEG